MGDVSRSELLYGTTDPHETPLVMPAWARQVPELAKQTQILATNMGSWVVPGALCAGLYLAMSLPLAAVARRLELRWKTTPQ